MTSVAGRVGTVGAEADVVAGEMLVCAGLGADVTVVAVAPARSQGFGGEGMVKIGLQTASNVSISQILGGLCIQRRRRRWWFRVSGIDAVWARYARRPSSSSWLPCMLPRIGDLPSCTSIGQPINMPTVFSSRQLSLHLRLPTVGHLSPACQIRHSKRTIGLILC